MIEAIISRERNVEEPVFQENNFDSFKLKIVTAAQRSLSPLVAFFFSAFFYLDDERLFLDDDDDSAPLSA